VLLELELTPQELKTILTSPDLNIDNVERFVYKWRCVQHTHNKAVFEMLQLWLFKTHHWD